MLTLNLKGIAIIRVRRCLDVTNSLDAIRADQQNFLDQTEDEVKEVAATTNVNEAVEAITAHINKYDVPEEEERK
jgi:hypothetical protein